MSFRSRPDRHDWWGSFVDRNQASLERLELLGVAQSEDRFSDYLETGNADGGCALPEVSDDKFLQLQDLVKQAFPDAQDESGFTVYRAERLRRFGRYG